VGGLPEDTLETACLGWSARSAALRHTQGRFDDLNLDGTVVNASFYGKNVLCPFNTTSASVRSLVARRQQIARGLEAQYSRLSSVNEVIPR
jgi:hypothetical protein